jgi:hypothetical protein
MHLGLMGIHCLYVVSVWLQHGDSYSPSFLQGLDRDTLMARTHKQAHAEQMLISLEISDIIAWIKALSSPRLQ